MCLLQANSSPSQYSPGMQSARPQTGGPPYGCSRQTRPSPQGISSLHSAPKQAGAGSPVELPVAPELSTPVEVEEEVEGTDDVEAAPVEVEVESSAPVEDHEVEELPVGSPELVDVAPVEVETAPVKPAVASPGSVDVDELEEVEAGSGLLVIKPESVKSSPDPQAVIARMRQVIMERDMSIMGSFRSAALAPFGVTVSCQ